MFKCAHTFSLADSIYFSSTLKYTSLPCIYLPFTYEWSVRPLPVRKALWEFRQCKSESNLLFIRAMQRLVKYGSYFFSISLPSLPKPTRSQTIGWGTTWRYHQFNSRYHAIYSRLEYVCICLHCSQRIAHWKTTAEQFSS